MCVNCRPAGCGVDFERKLIHAMINEHLTCQTLYFITGPYSYSRESALSESTVSNPIVRKKQIQHQAIDQIDCIPRFVIKQLKKINNKA